MAEHTTVNRRVMGSTPIPGAAPAEFDHGLTMAASLPGAAFVPDCPALPDYKYCPGCCGEGGSLPASAFARNRARKDGLQNYCRTCRKKYDRQTYLDNRNAFIERNAQYKLARAVVAKDELWAYLLAHPCVTCHENDPVVLEFHHPDPNKENAIGKMTWSGYLWVSIVKEIEKCEVLCANCHRRVTARERGYWRSHR